jgi:hypothetical protein
MYAGVATALILRRPAAAQLPAGFEIADGPFKGTRESLRDYHVPTWFRDAKFGIWALWGPQRGVAGSIPENPWQADACIQEPGRNAAEALDPPHLR